MDAKSLLESRIECDGWGVDDLVEHGTGHGVVHSLGGDFLPRAYLDDGLHHGPQIEVDVLDTSAREEWEHTRGGILIGFLQESLDDVIGSWGGWRILGVDCGVVGDRIVFHEFVGTDVAVAEQVCDSWLVHLELGRPDIDVSRLAIFVVLPLGCETSSYSLTYFIDCHIHFG